MDSDISYALGPLFLLSQRRVPEPRAPSLPRPENFPAPSEASRKVPDCKRQPRITLLDASWPVFCHRFPAGIAHSRASVCHVPVEFLSAKPFGLGGLMINLRQLFLRCRLDRVILAECNGEEACSAQTESERPWSGNGYPVGFGLREGDRYGVKSEPVNGYDHH